MLRNVFDGAQQCNASLFALDAGCKSRSIPRLDFDEVTPVTRHSGPTFLAIGSIAHGKYRLARLPLFLALPPPSGLDAAFTTIVLLARDTPPSGLGGTLGPIVADVQSPQHPAGAACRRDHGFILADRAGKTVAAEKHQIVVEILLPGL